MPSTGRSKQKIKAKMKEITEWSTGSLCHRMFLNLLYHMYLYMLKSPFLFQKLSIQQSELRNLIN